MHEQDPLMPKNPPPPPPNLTPRQRQILAYIRFSHAERKPLNIAAVKRDRPDLLDEVYAVRPF